MEYEIRPNESVSMAVVRAVSALEDREPDQLQPFSEVIDPDALDKIFERHQDGNPRIGGHVSFVYSSYQVTIEHGEYLRLEKIGPELRKQADNVPRSED